MLFKGSCHCGDLRIEVEGEIGEVIDCDCSICRMTGYLHWIVDKEQVKFHAQSDSLATYIWGSGEARHYFCRTCGVAPLRRPRLAPEGYSVNVRCLEGVQIEGLDIKPYNGRDLK
ncbi:GFA family protein [Litchfieldella rifensis]|uniref:GFA family protein n=1 Tax=Litchfieldella rifensis TaxID=762643 RepID=A0ABV7LJH6_9GAMM